jgi:hypothetical protein
MPSRISGRTSKYPFAELKPGQCFLETDVVDAKKVAARLTSAVGMYRSKVGADAPKFSVRIRKQDDGTDAVGVWRA